MSEALLSISILSQITGNWSKWGGGRISLVSLISSGEWYCQNCGKTQTKDLPSYMVPVDHLNRDFAKVCSECKRKLIIEKFKTFFELNDLKTHD